MISFWNSKQEGEDDEDVENDEEKSVISYFIISRKNRLLGVWYFGYIVCCLLSSYFYIYIAAFHHKEDSGNWWFGAEITFELIFFVQMCLTFLTDYADEDSGKSVRDIGMISTRYLKTDFFIDLLPLIPLPHFGVGHSLQHWYIIKVMRLMIASKVFDTHAIYTKIQAYHMKHLHWIADNDPILAEDQELNQNKID